MGTDAYSDSDSAVSTADTSPSLMGRWRQGRQRLRQYAVVLLWLVKDSIWRSKLLAISVVLLGFAGVTFRVSAFGFAVYYARLLQKGKTFSLLQWQFDPRHSAPLLVLFAFGVMFAFLLSSLLVYASQMLVLRMMGRYERHNIERALRLFGRHPAPSRAVAYEPVYTEQGFIKLISGDVRMIGRALRMLLSLIVPVSTFLVAVAALFLIDVPLTLLVLALIMVASAFLYRISRRGVAHTRTMEATARGAQDCKRALMKWAAGLHTPELAENDRIDEVVGGGEVDGNLRAFVGRLAVLERCALTNDIVFASVLLAVIVVLGRASISQQASWGLLVVYLLALRYAMNKLKHATRLLTSINRFYPLFQRYFRFVEISQDPPPPTGLYHPTHTVSLQERAIPDSEQQLTLTSGSRLALLTHTPLSRYSLAEVFDRIGMADERECDRALGSVSFVCREFGCPPVTLREFVRYGPEQTWSNLIGELAETGLAQQAREQLVRNLDRRLDEKVWGRVQPPVRFALAMLAVCRSQSAWVVLEQEGFDAMPVEARDRFLNRLTDRVVIVVSAKNWTLSSSHMSHVAVTDGQGPIGLGTVDWARAHQEEVQQQMIARAPADFQAVPSAAEVPEEDEIVDVEE